MPATHRVAYVETPGAFSSMPVPLGKQVPFGWPAFALKRGGGVVLSWRTTPVAPRSMRLTLALAEREHKVVEVVDIASGEVAATFEWHAPAFLQTLEVELPKNIALGGGVLLRVVRGNDPVFFFGVGVGQKPPLTLSPMLLPHVLEFEKNEHSDPLGEFYPRLQSMASLQAFGWRTGGVWEGLWALSRLPGGGKARSALNSQLSMALSPGGRLSYLNPSNHPVEKTPHGVEVLYPLSFLAAMDPHHKAVVGALQWADKHTDPATGAIRSGDLLLRDALPAATFFGALARHGDRDSDFASRAWAQLAARREALIDGEAIWSLAHSDGRKHGMNRSRSLGFFALAVARTLELLPSESQAGLWRERAAELAEVILNSQRTDGLWGVFFDPTGFSADEGDPEAGATSLFALFLMIGVREGWLGPEARISAARAATALREQLTPDGYLFATEAESPPYRPAFVPPGGFPASAFEDGDFQLPEPPPTYPTGELAPWAMGWLAAALAELS